MPQDEIMVGDKVTESPVGAGSITSVTDRGFPRVNEVAVSWLVTEAGLVFDPYKQRPSDTPEGGVNPTPPTETR